VTLSQDSRSVQEIKEKPEYECLVNAGIYMLEPKIVDLVPKNAFFDMVSLIKRAIEAGCKVGAFPVYEYWRDIGRHQEMSAASSDLSAKAKAEASTARKGEQP